MLRFIKHNLTSMLGIEIYPLISLILFTVFFAFVLLFVWKMSKERITELAASPLDLEQNEATTNYLPNDENTDIKYPPYSDFRFFSNLELGRRWRQFI
jgi:hypothetical protein